VNHLAPFAHQIFPVENRSQDLFNVLV
jgi:hypothetical protein